MRTSRIVGMGLTLLAAACGGDPELVEPIDEQGDAAEKSLTPVASLTVENGKTVEFYDFKWGALISETGEAYSTPVLRSRGKTAAQLVEIWQELAPAKPVPQALRSLETRLKNIQEPPPRASRELGMKLEANGNQAVQTLGPVGCNNGCCDFEWLSTLTECDPNGFDNAWFLYNYGATWSNIDEIAYYEGLACSAEGTSSFKVNIAGSGGTWSVPQAHFRTFHWTAAWSVIWCSGPCGEDLRSRVNTTANQHLHTYCGGVWYD